MKTSLLLIFGLFLSIQQIKADVGQAYDICFKAAKKHERLGYSFGSSYPARWCSSVSNVWEARCRKVALGWKRTITPDLNVSGWCRPVRTRAVHRCRVGAMEYKENYDFSFVISSFCSDVRTVAEANCRVRKLINTQRPRRAIRLCQGF